MRLLTLYSGSTGNATYVEAGGAKILIDAGKSARRLCSSLCEAGSSIDDIDAIFITHEHSDHVSSLETLCKKHSIPIHITEGSAKKFCRCDDRFSCIQKNLVAHTPLFDVNVKGVSVQSFCTPHDSMMSVGYRIDFDEDGRSHSFAVATDIGYVTDDIFSSLLGCEAVVLESNHDVQMLNDGPYPYDLKQRILSKRGHLSNEQSSLLASRLVPGGTKYFILAHLSEENNTPDTALDEFLSAVADPDVTVLAADPEAITEIIF